MAIPITFYMKKRQLMGKMTMEIFDMDNNLITELPVVSRKGINQVLWAPVQKPPRAPISEAVPFQMQIAMMGGGMRYPAGEYKVRVTRKDEVFEKLITLYDNPDEPYSAEDRMARRKLQQKGFDLMEDLAYLDRRINDVRRALSEADNIPLQISLEKIRERLLVTNYGDLRGDARLREDVGFLYGTISFYDGKPTQVQYDRMDLLETRVRAMESEVDKLLEDSLEGIVISSREAFDAEN